MESNLEICGRNVATHVNYRLGMIAGGKTVHIRLCTHHSQFIQGRTHHWMTVEGDDTKRYAGGYTYCRKKPLIKLEEEAINILPTPKKEIPMPTVKPPLGVPSLEIHRALRIKDLSRAVIEQIDHKKAVKQDWLDELSNLVRGHNQWIKSKPIKVGNPYYTG